eukprot:g11278.t1
MFSALKQVQGGIGQGASSSGLPPVGGSTPKMGGLAGAAAAMGGKKAATSSGSAQDLSNDSMGIEELAKINKLMNKVAGVEEPKPASPFVHPSLQNKEKGGKNKKETSVDATLNAQESLRQLRLSTTNLVNAEREELVDKETGEVFNESSSKARSRWLKIRAGVKVTGAFKGNAEEQEKRLERIRLAELEKQVQDKEQQLFMLKLELKEKITFFDKERMATHTVVSNAVERYREAELQSRQTRDLLQTAIREHESLQEEHDRVLQARFALEAKVKKYLELIEEQKQKIADLSVAVDPLVKKVQEMNREIDKLETRIQEDAEEPNWNRVQNMSRSELESEVAKVALKCFKNMSNKDYEELSRKILLEQLYMFANLRPQWEEDIAYEKSVYEEGKIICGEIDEEKIQNGIDENLCRGVTMSTNPKMVKDFARYIVNSYRKNQNDFSAMNHLLLRNLSQNYDKVQWNVVCGYAITPVPKELCTYTFFTRLPHNYCVCIFSTPVPSDPNAGRE